MQNKYKRFISVLILTAMTFNLMPHMTREAYALTPTQVNDATSKFMDAVGRIATNTKVAENIGKVTDIVNRLGGLTSIASGVIGILQMIGVIKDPTMEMLGQILDAVKDVQDTLANMNKTLNTILGDLVQIQSTLEEKERNNKATQMSTNWNNFNTNYTEKLQAYTNEYQAKINTGISDWWKQASHEGVYVLITLSGDEHLQTYSTQEYSQGLPATADNGETVNKEWSIGIPSKYIPAGTSFNINTYRNDFKNAMITALKQAISEKGLAADCGESFMSEYSNADDKIAIYAEYVLNEIIYKVSCNVMTNNNTWVTQVITTYNQYCDNILKQDSGINAFLNYIYLTHAFEGEVKEDIEKFCDGQIVLAGYYGQLALTCAGQDSLYPTSNKEALRDNFVNTITKIANTKAKAITGKDNYCYITGTVVEASTTQIHSDIYAGRSSYRAYSGCDAHSWAAEVPSIVTSVYMPIIYKQYTKLPHDAKSFGEYLKIYGAQSDSDNKTYMTNYRGAETFAFSEGIRMQAHNLIDGANYFSDGSWYNIDVGTGSKVEQQYYEARDKVLGDWFDSSNGNASINAILAARAFYGEDHGAWYYDEMWAFSSEGVGYSTGDGYGYDKVLVFTRDVNILKSSPAHDLNGDGDLDFENPFFAFNMVSLIPGVSDNMDPHYQTMSKDITEVLLDSESFQYTGQPITPNVTVFASDDVVPKDGYTVEYFNNIESGDNAVVRVTGKGDYSGVISKRFTITESGSGFVYGSSSSGCNAMSSMFIALGLGFIFLRKKLQKP